MPSRLGVVLQICSFGAGFSALGGFGVAQIFNPGPVDCMFGLVQFFSVRSIGRRGVSSERRLRGPRATRMAGRSLLRCPPEVNVSNGRIDCALGHCTAIHNHPGLFVGGVSTTTNARRRPPKRSAHATQDVQVSRISGPWRSVARVWSGDMGLPQSVEDGRARFSTSVLANQASTDGSPHRDLFRGIQLHGESVDTCVGVGERDAGSNL